MIYVIGYKDLTYIDKNDIIIDVTSKSDSFGKYLSPFKMGPVKLYGDYISKNMESAYQYCKVYARFLDEKGDPSLEYFKWAERGWGNSKPERYPIGKGVSPVYFYWNGKKLSQVEARREIFIPLYSKTVKNIDAFGEVVKLFKTSQDIYLLDFDGYNNKMMGLSYDDVINNDKKVMSHAFVISMIIDGFIGEFQKTTTPVGVDE